MKIKLTNELLTAYVLGEVDDAIRASIESALEKNVAAQKTVAELRATVKLATETLGMEPMVELSEEQRKSIAEHAVKAPVQSSKAFTKRRLVVRPLVPIAALLIIGLALLFVILPALEPAREAALHPNVSKREASGAKERLMSPMREKSAAPAMPVKESGKDSEYLYSESKLAEFDKNFSKPQPKPEPKQPSSEEKEQSGGLQNIEVGGSIKIRGNWYFPGQQTTSDAGSEQRYLIKTASVLIETGDPRVAQDGLEASLATFGGYVANMRETVDPIGRRSISVQVRVPADQFDVVMNQMNTLGKVLNREISTQDVGEEYVDKDARVRNLKQTEERLLEHLKRTGLLKDIVEIEREINRVREEIEKLEGRLRYLDNRIAYSTISITFQETPKAEPVMPPQTFSSAKVASEAVRNLLEFLQRFWAEIIRLGVWSVVWLPVLVIIGTIILIVIRAIRWLIH